MKSKKKKRIMLHSSQWEQVEEGGGVGEGWWRGYRDEWAVMGGNGMEMGEQFSIIQKLIF